jgi:hypothetical protein
MNKPEKKSHIIIGLLFILLWIFPLKIFGQEAIPLAYLRDANDHLSDSVNFIGWVKKVKHIKLSKEISFQIYDKNRDDQPILVVIKEDLITKLPALNVKNLTGNILRVTGVIVKNNEVNVVHIFNSTQVANLTDWEPVPIRE